MKFAAQSVIGVAGLLALAGCAAVGPDYKTPKTETPAEYRQSLEGGLKQGPTDLTRWWTRLNDPTLDSLIQRSLAGNLDLREAEQRLREARAQRGVIAADQYPQVDAVGDVSRQRLSKNGQSFQQDLGGTSFDNSSDFYNVGFDASWEIDVFGRVRRSIEAADADVVSAAEQRRDVLVSLLAEVARNYVELRSLQERLAIAENNVGVQRDSFNIADSRARAGISSELDARRAEAQLASTRSQIPIIQQNIRQSTNRLAVLLGQQPGTLTDELAGTAPVPPLPPEVPVGLPSDLLRRRPDIRKAEADLAGATARIGVATSDLFPRFSLQAALGLSSGEFNSWGDASSRYWSFVPGFRWPIFNGGRVKSNIEVQNAREQQALIRYEKSVLTALEDVENTLVAYEREQSRLAELETSVAAELQAVGLANELYTKGLTDFSAVIDAQRQLYLLQEQLAFSRRTRTTNLIALYKALGGGWEDLLPEAGPKVAEQRAPAGQESARADVPKG